MCDEATIIRWAKEGLNRRQFGALGGMAALSASAAACAPMGADGANGAPGAEGAITLPAMAERNVSFTTPDGTMDAFWVTPQTNPAPAVILWPDIAGLRPAKYDMARRLAGRGYSVLAVNPYYRDRSGQIWESFADFAANEGFAKAREYRGKLSSDAVMRDATAIVGWLDAQKEVDRQRGIGTQGYCMGGPFTMYSAAAVPARIKAAASFHGGGLVRDDDQSPHRLMEQMQAALLIAIAQDDDAEAPTHKAILREAAEAADLRAKVEVYAGDHGWTVPDSPAYAEAAAERAYADLLALYEGVL